ncbi:MAG: hybrid sensor histidine kinase/response regulator, partial [Elusimicrobia bacterium]|nr:hybrid sensor histidine kinase/response regulator [Elusimicrobiota bacterium]
HELNNPLTGIKGFTELLLRNKDIRFVPEFRESLEMIQRETLRCQSIVWNLSAYACAQKPVLSNVKINDLIEECLGVEAFSLVAGNIKVIKELSPDLPVLLADADQLKKVLSNLIRNAREAIAPHNKNEGRLILRSSGIGKTIRIEVEDNGPGIPPANLARIFDPFFTTKEVGCGTGLGLSIAYGVLHQHKGNLWAENAPEGGARLVMELPSTEPIEEAKGKPAELTPGEASPRESQKKLLIIDDEPIIRRVFSRILAKSGYSLDTAENGEDAQAKLMEGDYEGVFCDVRMPRMDGWSLFSWVKENRPQIVPRWVFVTGSIGEEVMSSVLHSGRPVIHKPFQIGEVDQLLKDLFAKSA